MADLPQFEKFGRTISPEDDPTHTITLRNRFVSQINKRWNMVKRVIRESVVTNDAFGLRVINIEALPGKSLSLLEPAEQLTAFMAWLRRQEQQTIMQDVGGPWIEPIMSAAFATGLTRGRRDIMALARGQKREVRNREDAPLIADLLTGFIPLTAEGAQVELAKVGIRASRALIVSQVWQSLSGITEQVNAQVANIVAQGLAAGLSPSELNRQIVDRVDKIGVSRGEMIARTAIVQANNMGAVAEFREAGNIIGEEVFIQWQATIDNRVRSNHLLRHGKIFKESDYIQLIGEPNCRCAGLPYVQSIEGNATQSSAKTFTRMAPKTAKKKAAPIRKEEGLRSTDG